MNAGLPGTGIGGLFYLIAALCLPIREIRFALQGRSSTGRWRMVGLLVGKTTLILSALWATRWLLGRTLLIANTLDFARTYLPSPWLPIAVLCGLLVSIEALSLLLRRRNSPD